MKILIKNTQILNPGSTFHKKKKDLLIDQGKILKIGDDLKEEGKVIEGRQLKVSIGWFDMRANFNDPGNEQKEDIITGCTAAAAGGFTGVALLPNTKPAIQSKNQIQYILAKANNTLVDVYPFGSITLDNKGEEITEMIDQYYAGAIAFTDGEKPLWNTDILLKALLYVRKFDGLIIDKPEDKWLNLFGNMHEGETSTSLGLKGMPSLAEEVIIERDLRILDYTGGKLHLSNISTSDGLKMIKNGKKRLDISCDIAAHQIAFDDRYLLDFDTNYKVNPPFRSKKDINSLIKGLQDGTIDIIVSSHSPHDEECKKLEFDHADFGISSLQTVYPILLDKLGQEGWQVFLDKITVNPRKRLGLEIPVIEENTEANLTVFDPTIEWVLDSATNQSKSVNSPFWNKKLKGKIIATINKNRIYATE